MWRTVLGIVVGFVVGVILVGLIEIPGYFLHPIPPGFDMNDPAALRAHMTKAPLAAIACVAIAWFVGPLVASWLAAFIGRRRSAALVIGIVFLAADITNLASFYHPLWLVLVGLLAPLAAAWLGALLAGRMSGSSSGPKPYDMRDKNMAC
jgi:hypothetical protein